MTRWVFWEQELRRKNMATDALLIVPTPEESPDPFKGETPTLAEFSKWRESGELPERVLTAAKEQPRDDAGKFAKGSWHEEAAYRRAILDGTIAPNDAMDVATWSAARNAQIARGTSNVPTPKPESEQKQQGEEPFLAQTHPHFQRAKQAESWYSDLVEAVKAVPFTISNEFGREIVELPNSADVLYKLAKNPDLLAELNKMNLKQRAPELAKISKHLDNPETTSTLNPDEWRKKREEQLNKRQER
jgi:hypothetical protein